MSLGKLARQLEIQLGVLYNVYIFLLLYIKPVINSWARSEPAVRLNKNRESCVTLYRNYRQQEAQQSLHYVAKLNCPSPYCIKESVAFPCQNYRSYWPNSIYADFCGMIHYINVTYFVRLNYYYYSANFSLFYVHRISYTPKMNERISGGA